MKIKVVIADVDGTLVTPSKALTPSTCQAVDRLRAAGIRFTITSGRPPRGMASLVGPLKLTEPLAAFNGAVYVKPDLKTVLAQRTIPTNVAREAVDFLMEAGLDVWVYQGPDWFIRDRDAFRVARERSNVGFDPVVIDDLDALLDDPIKIVGVSEDRPLVARAEAALNERMGAEAWAARSTPYYVDITHPDANKGMVLREVARILQIPLDEIAVLGDMANDVPMLSIAGMGIAMGNASPEVQRVARHVTTSNAEEGFAHAVDAFILGEPPVARTPLGLPPRARACLFNLDGVLARLGAMRAEAWKRILDHYLQERAQAWGQPFVPFDPVEDYRLHFQGRPPREAVRSFLDARGIELPEHTLQALAARKRELLLELYGRERVETYEGSVEYLRAVRAAGLRTAVVSSSQNAEQALESAGVADLFDARIDGTYARSANLDSLPSPDTYLAAAQALGVDTEDAVVFDDAIAGVEAGRAGHFGYVVGVDRLGQASDELRHHGADIVVPDLAALMH